MDGISMAHTPLGASPRQVLSGGSAPLHEAAGPGSGGRTEQQQGQPDHAQHGRSTAQHAVDQYTQPQHAEVAALLGQPVYDPVLALEASGAGMRRATSGPALSSIQEAAPSGVGVAGGSGVAGRGAVTPDLLAEKLWQHKLSVETRRRAGGVVVDKEAGGAWPIAYGQGWRRATSQREDMAVEGERGEGEADVRGFWEMPFVLRNAPLLRVIPKFCECRIAVDTRGVVCECCVCVFLWGGGGRVCTPPALIQLPQL
jgi:hypothetical protein